MMLPKLCTTNENYTNQKCRRINKKICRRNQKCRGKWHAQNMKKNNDQECAWTESTADTERVISASKKRRRYTKNCPIEHSTASINATLNVIEDAETDFIERGRVPMSSHQ